MSCCQSVINQQGDGGNRLELVHKAQCHDVLLLRLASCLLSWCVSLLLLVGQEPVAVEERATQEQRERLQAQLQVRYIMKSNCVHCRSVHCRFGWLATIALWNLTCWVNQFNRSMYSYLKPMHVLVHVQFSLTYV